MKIPNNRAMAEQHAACEDYTAFMNDIISKRYAVKASDEELGLQLGSVLPKEHKIHAVYDRGASYQGTSLNGQISPVPCLVSLPF